MKYYYERANLGWAQFWFLEKYTASKQEVREQREERRGLKPNSYRRESKHTIIKRMNDKSTKFSLDFLFIYTQ